MATGEVADTPSGRVRLERILACTPAAVMLIDEALTITWVNGATVDLFGFTPEEGVGRSVLDFLDPDWDDPLALESVTTALRAEGLRPPMVFRVVRADGTRTMVEVTANVQLHDPELRGLVVLVRPWEERYLIDETLEAMAAARPLEETLERLVRIAEAETLEADTTILFDLDQGRRAIHSPGLPAPLAGETGGSTGERDPWEVLLRESGPRVWNPDELPSPLAELAGSSGYRSAWAWPAVSDGHRLALVVAWRREERTDADQTRVVAMDRLARVAGLVIAKSRADAELAWAANHDPLTHLANRTRFFDVLGNALVGADDADGDGRAIGVLALDLDGFKPVNDRFGHAAGDEVLQLVAERIDAVVGERGLAARLGGDEFAVVLDEERHERGAESLADELREVVRTPLETTLSEDVVISVSIGVATCPAGSCSPDELLDVADGALYRAKSDGGDRVVVEAVG